MRSCIAMVVVLLSGCAAHYATPGRGARMEMFGAPAAEQVKGADGGIAAILDKKPLASFPAAVALVRVQAPGYQSHTACGIGGGRFSVVTIRDVEAETDMRRIDQLPMLRGVATLNRLVMPDNFQSDFELRQAAAKMRADMLLVYTIDTQFIDLNRATPLTLLTLGTTTTKNMRILCTASAAILDTRSGYVYGLAEGTKRYEELQNAWKTEDEVDKVRRDVESQAFADMVKNLQVTWADVVQENATPGRMSGGARYETVR